MSFSGSYTTPEAHRLLMSYQRDPSNVSCPYCGEGTIEILAFIDPYTNGDGYAEVKDPEGEYAAAIYCHRCRRGIGLYMRDWGKR